MNLSLACKVWNGISPIIVALHGFGGSSWDFTMLAENSPYRWVGIDLLGHGMSNKPTDSSAYRLRSQLQLLDRHLQEQHILLGYSMGGRLALHYTLTDLGHCCGLVLVGTTPGIVDEDSRQSRKQWDEQMAHQLEEKGSKIFFDEWAKLPIIQSQERIPYKYRQAMKRCRTNNDAHAVAASMRGFGSGAMPHCWSEISQLTIPILMIVGAEDQKYIPIANQMKNVQPAAELHLIANAGHCAHLEQPEAFQSILNEWIRRIWKNM